MGKIIFSPKNFPAPLTFRKEPLGKPQPFFIKGRCLQNPRKIKGGLPPQGKPRKLSPLWGDIGDPPPLIGGGRCLLPLSEGEWLPKRVTPLYTIRGGKIPPLSLRRRVLFSPRGL